MRLVTFTSALVLAGGRLMAAGAPPQPPRPDDVRQPIREWIEAMRAIQKEEDEWEKDREILQGYKETLEKEIENLKEQIGRAKVRRDGADQQSLEKVAERDRYAAARDGLVEKLVSLETRLDGKLPVMPKSLLADPKVAQCVEVLKRARQLPADKAGEDLSKRLLNAVELLAEIEKFQQGVHVHPELHKDSQNREFNVKVVYFGLSIAYAVNDDGSFALVGVPGEAGWKFTERQDLAPQIQKLLASTATDKDPAFTSLPLSKP